MSKRVKIVTLTLAVIIIVLIGVYWVMVERQRYKDKVYQAQTIVFALNYLEIYMDDVGDDWDVALCIDVHNTYYMESPKHLRTMALGNMVYMSLFDSFRSGDFIFLDSSGDGFTLPGHFAARKPSDASIKLWGLPRNLSPIATVNEHIAEAINREYNSDFYPNRIFYYAMPAGVYAECGSEYAYMIANLFMDLKAHLSNGGDFVEFKAKYKAFYDFRGEDWRRSGRN